MKCRRIKSYLWITKSLTEEQIQTISVTPKILSKWNEKSQANAFTLDKEKCKVQNLTLNAQH